MGRIYEAGIGRLSDGTIDSAQHDEGRGLRSSGSGGGGGGSSVPSWTFCAQTLCCEKKEDERSSGDARICCETTCSHTADQQL